MDEDIPITALFYNSDTNQPFANCMVCDVDLTSPTQEYFIEKIMRKVPQLDVHETLFEYAICMDCGTQFRSKMSIESMKNVETYFRAKLAERPPTKQSLDSCLLTGNAIESCKEYSYHAHCRGGKMLISIFPYAISDEAMDELAELLSPETNDELDDFKSKHFNGPPEIAELINPKRLLPI